jgi:hypothetical protein
MCYAAKWHGDREVIFHMHEDPHFLENLWHLLCEADVVVHYNGCKFDIPTINKDFLLDGMTPPDPYRQIDLYRVIRKKFKFPSNKLDYVADRLGVGKKHAHEGHELWVKCMNGDADAWRRMEKYNKQDVQLLEKLYDCVLPWIDNHPNHSLYENSDRPVCTNCGSAHVHSKGYCTTKTQKYRRWICQECNTNMRSRFALKRENPENVLTQEAL